MSDKGVRENEDPGAGASSGPVQGLTERLVGALETYLKSIQDIGQAQFDKQSAPYQDYLRTLTEAQGSPDAAERIQAAYVEQSRRIVEQQNEDAGRAGEEVRGAYDSYVRSVTEALAGHSAEQLPPPVLAGLGQHFLLVAQWAAATEPASAGKEPQGAR